MLHSAPSHPPDSAPPPAPAPRTIAFEPAWAQQPSEPMPLDGHLKQDLVDKGSSESMAEQLVDSIRTLLRRSSGR